ncbi:MAG: tetratricopeptide repeat protein [Chloroflexi bacterium]|nr:tetratricopeptide repeat protein [Chloroflexota bacterium]
MNKQEIFKQADYTFQRGNRELARKYLAELLQAYPDDEAAWMLLAKVVEEKERKVECYQRILKINPKNQEAKLALVRVQATINPTLPKQIKARPSPALSKNMIRVALITVILFFLFGATSFVVARNNPESQVAKVLAIATPTVFGQPALAEDVAAETRADVRKLYPQYAVLVDTLLSLALDTSTKGMEGAPERPGAAIPASDAAGMEMKSLLEKSLPSPGRMASITITEQQITSWLVMEMKNSPDLPLSDVQVYLRNGKVQMWGIVTGSEDWTSALAVAEIVIDDQKYPRLKIESVQIGQRMVPGAILSEVESWVNQLLQNEIEENAPGLQVVSLKVTNGLITVSGTR